MGNDDHAPWNDDNFDGFDDDDDWIPLHRPVLSQVGVVGSVKPKSGVISDASVESRNLPHQPPREIATATESNAVVARSVVPTGTDEKSHMQEKESVTRGNFAEMFVKNFISSEVCRSWLKEDPRSCIGFALIVVGELWKLLFAVGDLAVLFHSFAMQQYSLMKYSSAVAVIAFTALVLILGRKKSLATEGVNVMIRRFGRPEEVVTSPHFQRSLLNFLLLLPSVLQLRAISFLVDAVLRAKDDQVTVILSFSLLSFSYVVFLVVTTRALATNDMSQEKQKFTPILSWLVAFQCLYVSALLITVANLPNVSRLVRYFVPSFLVAEGVYILSCKLSRQTESGGSPYYDYMDWIGNTICRNLRCTLRQVLAEQHKDLSEEEVFRLAMMGWIADYGTNSKAGAMPTPTATPSVPQPPTHNGSSASLQSMYPPGRRSSERQNEGTTLGWQELLSTLHPTIEGMFRDWADEQRHSSAMSSSNAGPADHMKDVLLSLDLDGVAKPAIESYRNHVESLPPSWALAVLIGWLRRCPALLVALSLIVRGNLLGLVCLSSLIGLELWRVSHWAAACRRDAAACPPLSDTTEQPTTTTRFWHIPRELDPMMIMLNGEQQQPQAEESTALSVVVWTNVKWSATTILPSSLTAARCAQTTCAATEVAQSLALWGEEWEKGGWARVARAVALDVLTKEKKERKNHTRQMLQLVPMMGQNVAAVWEEGNFSRLLHSLLSGWLGTTTTTEQEGEKAMSLVSGQEAVAEENKEPMTNLAPTETRVKSNGGVATSSFDDANSNKQDETEANGPTNSDEALDETGSAEPNVVNRDEGGHAQEESIGAKREAPVNQADHQVASENKSDSLTTVSKRDNEDVAPRGIVGEETPDELSDIGGNEEDDNNLLAILGGGVAIVGAVVGGLALLQRGNDSDNPPQKTEERK